ncbi:MAG: hypothetical protein ACYDA9_03570 [Terriglobia bacterium]
MTTDEEKLSKKDYTDYEFIVNEVGRLLQLTPQELQKYYSEHKDDALCMLWDQARTLPGTRACYERFDQIVTRGLKALGPNARTHDRNTLRNLLIRKFAAEAEKIIADTTAENAHEIFETVLSAAEKEYKALTHYIPCFLVAQKSPERFSIGPVTFVVQDAFMKANESALRASITAGPSSDLFLTSLQSFFSTFGWVATVRVPACDDAVSTSVARRVVQSALNLFKLFVGSDRASNVRQRYDTSIPGATSTLALPDSGIFLASNARKLRDAVVPEDWHEQLTEIRQWRTGQRILSNAWENWGDVSEPYQRFLDAMSWHGDAIVEQDPQARILKFWTAIERVVSLKNGDPVTRRAAIMSVHDVSDFDKRFLQCQKLYANRSDIVHGTEAYCSARSPKVASQTEELSKWVLMNYLRMINDLESLAPLTREALIKALRLLDTISKAASSGKQKDTPDEPRSA